MKIGTAAQLKLNVGDVVDTIDWLSDSFTRYQTVLESNIIDSGKFYGQYEIRLSDYGKGIFDDEKFRILTRATPEPKLWRDMTAEEKGALLLAAHDGAQMQYKHNIDWQNCNEVFSVNYAYRIKPQPKVETVEFTGHIDAGIFFRGLNSVKPQVKITFTTIDGKPDCASVKMGAIE